MDPDASPGPDAAPPTPAAQAGCACLCMVVIAAVVFFGIIAVATEPENAGGIFLLLAACSGLLAALAAATGHKEAAWLSGFAGLGLLAVSMAAFFGS
ncbi:hypothetical protein [Nonomuraea rhodomycinica]|uniref:Uncharacterized protein n=1 Tax=Nonomuraea rhodomycinica TaxID=1712872 RepID=A0A7Y6MHH9_9ACTN|nr:hypothetical protein [Nonomuraea rhodomycinica]NUW46999.1 hypothetical protein [Nonomuraea rhodomycinica]